MLRLAKSFILAAKLSIDFAVLAEKRKRDEKRLTLMIRFADVRACRHSFILDYFGDETPHAGCVACDNCLGKGRGPARLPDTEETVILQKALSCVARMNGRYGRGRVTQVLMGSSSKEVTTSGLDKLSTYGLLKDEGTDYIWNLIDALIAADCVRADRSEFPVLSLTPLGDDVMRLRKTIPLHLPVRRKKAAAGDRPKKTAALGDEASFDERVYEALKAWRRDKAAEMGDVPAFLIYGDRTMRDLARARPGDEESLRRVRGIGPAKLAQFGRETLEVIAQAGGV